MTSLHERNYAVVYLNDVSGATNLSYIIKGVVINPLNPKKFICIPFVITLLKSPLDVFLHLC
jgi:hypothetical protein